jgi:hypothetical protein
LAVGRNNEMSTSDVAEIQNNIKNLVECLQPHNTLNPPSAFWIESADGGIEYDPDGAKGDYWCEEHGEDLVMRLNLYTPGDGECSLLCGDPCSNNDTIPRCSTCGITLAGWPTDYCLTGEMDYFESDSDWEPSPENLHVIGMALWNLQWSEDISVMTEWEAIGKAALEKLRLTPLGRTVRAAIGGGK